ncbi:unnamed protein product [Cylindrotheca closterium]|uniref:Helicase-associated domain-containing protein n=1 Tax=Cylindrotheca closterium TaxID=2856 RepID=A0AAD2FYS5_9STRA|nr:unnamed protein product [Cylindrotheca closterium]
MISSRSTNNDKLRKDSYSCSKIANGNLMSLLAHPLMSSSLDHFQSFSFENPFDDPSMEPLPLRSQSQLPQVVHSSSGSNHLRDLMGSLDSIATNVGSKRGSEEAFFTDDQICLSKKRQRTSPVQATSANEEEVMARFRPYQETQWRSQFKKLVEYKFEHGHCCVPHSYPEDPILARWVKRQRYQFKKLNDNDPTSTMTSRRIQDLDSIGFVWHSHASAWQEKVNELMAFKQANGHCNVPSHYPKNAALSTWVKCQRRQWKRFIRGISPSPMTMDRIQLLESLGFVFDILKSKQSS